MCDHCDLKIFKNFRNFFQIFLTLGCLIICDGAICAFACDTLTFVHLSHIFVLKLHYCTLKYFCTLKLHFGTLNVLLFSLTCIIAFYYSMPFYFLQQNTGLL